MSQSDIGVFGLGTMGSALALNLLDNGFRVSVANREGHMLDDFTREASDSAETLTACPDLAAFVASLKTPRVVLFMIPSGAPMDEMIATISPLLKAGDTIIDAGNADFNDTRRRFAELAGSDIHFVGMGVSGGEEGARHGPSMMVGGTAHSWSQLRPMAEAVAAKFQGSPCVDHLGPNGAGHFVKTVHNGIEYADMQMISEVYGLMRDGAGRDAGAIGEMFARWNDGPLESYLIEASAAVLKARDAKTGVALVDVIEDKAGQKGTGRWTLIEALKLGQSANTIEAAVGARGWSSQKTMRRHASGVLAAGTIDSRLPDEEVLAQAFEAARVISHAQGFAILRAASEEFGWALDLARIAEIWRAGCIIRSALLDDLAAALRRSPPFDLLVLDDGLADRIGASIPALRALVAYAVSAGLPVPALASALSWYDSIRQERGVANLIQGQRDYFGRHGFARIGEEGVFHGPWAD